jgi:hypothetical protein
LIRGKKHSPIRTCISCGKKNFKNVLIRLVLNDDDEVKLDRRGTMPGRGAYVCRRKECIQRAMQARVLCKAFRRRGAFTFKFSDPEEIRPIESF